MKCSQKDAVKKTITHQHRKNKLIALSDRMANPINQEPMHVSGVYCTRPARQHHYDHATPVQGVAPSGLKAIPERFFTLVIKNFYLSGRTDRLNDRALIALTHSLNGTHVALTASYPGVWRHIKHFGAPD
jgi:hypothetical protein